MTSPPLHIILADDDADDCLFFKEAIEELPVTAQITIMHDGVHLMQWLTTQETLLPDALFLDLNMPRKSGFDCLAEIKSSIALMHLPVIIYSTSLNIEVVDLLYKNGAHYYIRKPGEFDQIKHIIFKALALVSQKETSRPSREKFILQF